MCRHSSAHTHRLRKDAAVGVDGVSKEQYGQNLEQNLRDLHERMKTKRYACRFEAPWRRLLLADFEHHRVGYVNVGRIQGQTKTGEGSIRARVRDRWQRRESGRAGTVEAATQQRAARIFHPVDA